LRRARGWAFGLLGSALQLRDGVDAQAESAGEGGMAFVGELAEVANLYV